jgi:hypothetical protein
MKLNLKLFPEIRLLRLHNVMKKILGNNSLITSRIGIRTERIKIIFDLISVTGMVHRYIYGGACIRPAAPTRFGLTPHLPLAKIPRIPRIEYQAYLHTHTTHLSLKILSVASFR